MDKNKEKINPKAAGDIDQINEYLTSIKLSDEAFMYLVNYFKTIDRPVVICMVGDHSPAFAKDIVDKKYENDKYIEYRVRIPKAASAAERCRQLKIC